AADQPVDVLLTGTDADGDELSFEVSTEPNAGSLGVITPLDETGALVEYTPAPGFTGTDEFGFIVSDGIADSEEAFVRVTVDPPPNGSPRAIGLAVATDEDTPRLIRLEATDPDGDALEFRIAGGPVVGDLGPITRIDDTRAEVVYTPPAGFSGEDRFTFTASDGQLTSAPAAVDITVREVADDGNRAPRVQTVEVSTTVDEPVTVYMGGEDPDGDELIFEVEGAPEHGTLGLVEAFDRRSSRVVYTPDPGYEGEDSFRFRAFDGALYSAYTTAFIEVNPPINHPPTADARTISVTEDSATPISLTGSDPDGDALAFTVTGGPEHGTLSGGETIDASTYRITYTPDTGYTGSDAFTFTVHDGELESEPAEVAITVNEAPEANVAPEAQPISATTTRDEAVTLTLTGTDANGDPLTFAIDAAPANGSLGELTAIDDVTARVVYTPDMGFEGTDGFTFTVFDGELTSEPAEATVTVEPPPNTAPVAVGGSTETESGEAVTVLLNGSDEDGDALDFAIVDAPTNGSLGAIEVLGPESAEVVYTPADGFVGDDSFTFRVSDGEDASAPATIGVTVLPPNAAPVADPTSVALLKDGSVEITLTGSDADGDPLTFEITSAPGHGSLGEVSSTGPTSGTVTYTPEVGFVGTDAFIFRASDGRETSSPASVELEVRETNEAPTALPLVAGTTRNNPVTLVLEGSDPDGDLLHFEITGGPSHGSLGPLVRLSDQSVEVVYTPASNYDGEDAFTFRVHDGIATSEDATVSLTVDTPGTLIFVVPDPAFIDAIDGTLEVKVRVIGPNGEPQTLPNVKFSSSDESVFTLTKTSDSTAVITAVGNGVADAIVKSGSTTKTALVTVEQVVASVEILHEGDEPRVGVGSTIQFTAVPLDRNGFAVDGRTAAWESSDPELLSVESDTDLIGTGTGLAEGTVTVTATVDGVSATLEVVIDP
ncbi:MAG: Ig-like domain-containing protein, partial [Halobacteriales archaeon]|nr:Ig-like domain-containing protein [Halobacteriales archaeon]